MDTISEAESLTVIFSTETHEDICQSRYGCSKVAMWDWLTQCPCGGLGVCQAHRDKWEKGTTPAYYCLECKTVVRWWKFVPHRRNRNAG